MAHNTKTLNIMALGLQYYAYTVICDVLWDQCMCMSLPKVL